MKAMCSSISGTCCRMGKFLTDSLCSFWSDLTVWSEKLEIMDAEFSPVREDAAEMPAIILPVW